MEGVHPRAAKTLLNRHDQVQWANDANLKPTGRHEDAVYSEDPVYRGTRLACNGCMRDNGIDGYSRQARRDNGIDGYSRLATRHEAIDEGSMKTSLWEIDMGNEDMSNHSYEYYEEVYIPFRPVNRDCAGLVLEISFFRGFRYDIAAAKATKADRTLRLAKIASAVGYLRAHEYVYDMLLLGALTCLSFPLRKATLISEGRRRLRGVDAYASSMYDGPGVAEALEALSAVPHGETPKVHELEGKYRADTERVAVGKDVSAIFGGKYGYRAVLRSTKAFRMGTDCRSAAVLIPRRLGKRRLFLLVERSENDVMKEDLSALHGYAVFMAHALALREHQLTVGFRRPCCCERAPPYYR
ncbi:hypothetical protein ACFLSJ_00965 [Verrucomicrobiota bacterium]